MIGLAIILAPGGSAETQILAAFFFGIGNGGVGMTLWAGFSDVAAREAAGREGLAFGLFSGLAKICLALGALALGQFLGEVDYRQSDSDALLLLMAGSPAVGAMACLLIARAWWRAMRRVDASVPDMRSAKEMHL